MINDGELSNVESWDKRSHYSPLDLRGLSRDEKPKVTNGSSFLEIDTGKVYFYDAENDVWREQ